MENNFYVPILKWKRGEQIGVRKLTDLVKDKIVPLIEIPEIDWDFDNECFKKSIDEHLENTAKTISDSWGTNREFFLDIPWADDDMDNMAHGQHPLDFLFDDFRNYNLLGIPVIKSSSNHAYLATVKDIVKTDNQGICIRIKDEDLLDLEDELEKLLDEIEVSKDESDLVIDLEYINLNDQNKNLLSIINILRAISDTTEWRSITVCATSFPENTSLVNRNTTGKIERGEWTLWNNLLSRKSKLKVMPNFGDYAISNPKPFTLDPKLMKMSANIRYTINNDFLIFKGISIQKGKWAQAQNLCKKIISHPQYCGQTFSWGDDYIFKCSKGSKSTGNAETWRRVGTNHHLTFVINQLSNLHVL